MTTDLNDIKHGADLLVSTYAERDGQGEALRRMFHMEWSDQPDQDWIKATMSPSAYNAVMGVTRIMTSTNPAFSVPFDEAEADSKGQSEKLERAAKALWGSAGRAMGRAAHYDLVLSGALFGEMAASVTATADLLEHARQSGDTRNVKRMEALSKQTPYTFDVYNPLTVYADRDRFGLRGVLRRTQTTYGAVLDEWGQLADRLTWGSKGEPGRRQAVTLCDWYDWEQRAVWLDGLGGDDPILHEDHGLPFLPFEVAVTEGTALFAEPHLQRFPLLYGMLKSNLWKRENLSLTMIYSLVFALGSSPLLMWKAEEESGNLVIDRSLPAGVVRLKKDEDLQPLAQKVLDPAQTFGLELAQNLNEESTISKMALGAPPDNALAYSAINTLVQSGRLPLMGIKEMGGKVIGKLVTTALAWLKHNGGEGNRVYADGQGYVELRPADIPDEPALNVGLDPDLPTDKLQLANIAEALTGGENPLASKRWARENILNIGQSDAMDREIWAEKRAQLEFQKAAAMIAQAMQQSAQNGPGGPQPPAGASGPGLPPGGAGGPEPGVYPPGGQVGPGAPLAGALPPGEQQGQSGA